MRLSIILDQMLERSQYEIRNEREFEYLAITDSELVEPVCTFLDNVKFIEAVKDNVVMILTTEELAEEIEKRWSGRVGVGIVENPRILFFQMHNHLANNEEYVRQKFQTTIGEETNISPLASIAANNVTIGNNVTIEEFVVVRENTIISDNTIIRSGSKIGSQGFEFKYDGEKTFAVNHLGGVVLGKDVEIHCNTCVDKAVYPWDDTVIGDYSKIDNLVHIGHGVKMKDNVMMVSHSSLGGRTILESGVWIGLHATVTNGIRVGKNARVNIGAVATKSVPDNGSVSGNFAIDHKKFIEHIKGISK